MIESLFESQDDVIFYVLFSDLNLFYLIYGRSIFSKWPNIGMVFLATVDAYLALTLPISPHIYFVFFHFEGCSVRYGDLCPVWLLVLLRLPYFRLPLHPCI